MYSTKIEIAVATHIKFESLHGSSVGPWDRRKESQHLFDDTVQVLEAHNGVQPQLSFGAEAAIVEETPGSQLLSQAFQDGRVAEELHDEWCAGAGRGGEGGKDQLDGRLLWDDREARWCISALVPKPFDLWWTMPYDDLWAPCYKLSMS